MGWGGPEHHAETPEWLSALAAAAQRMPVPSRMRPPEHGGRRSAVLILFGAGDRGPDILLIQRKNGLRRHSGQPAFPGGSIEPSDLSAEDAAIREAEEETGVRPDGIELMGRLPELYLSRSDFRVVPVLAWWRVPSAVHAADTGEVDAVTRVPLADLADPGNRVRARHPDGSSGPAFQVHGMLVWGFTAQILNQLLVLGGWERPWLDAGTEETVIAVPPVPPEPPERGSA
ncbi:NUDIX hydrolase [Lipingzhangella halophila]|nr:CoA pyrophosphatase [Lipingzhangella halophila]